MADIVKSRNRGQNGGPVKVPLYQCGSDVQWDSITTMPVVNKVVFKGAGSGTSILSVLAKNTEEYTDISGEIVTMIAKIGDNVFSDVVKVIGCTNTGFVVEIEGEEYTVRRSIVRFVVGDCMEVTE